MQGSCPGCHLTLVPALTYAQIAEDLGLDAGAAVRLSMDGFALPLAGPASLVRDGDCLALERCGAAAPLLLAAAPDAEGAGVCDGRPARKASRAAGVAGGVAVVAGVPAKRAGAKRRRPDAMAGKPPGAQRPAPPSMLTAAALLGAPSWERNGLGDGALFKP